MIFRYFLFVIFAIISSQFAIFAGEQSSNVRYSKSLNITNGLSHNGVSCTLIDSRGYLWIGTYDGLNRHSGDDVKIYKNMLHKRLFQNNRVLSLAEDSLSRLWVGTDAGVTIFNYNKHSFEPLSAGEGEDAVSIDYIFISKNYDRVICISKEHKIMQYDTAGNLLRCDMLPESTKINCAIKINSDNYLIACNKGIFSYNILSGESRSICHGNIKPIFTIAKIDDSRVALCYTKGVQLFDYKIDNDAITITPISNTEYLDSSVTAIAKYDDSSLLFGCKWSGGVFKVCNYIDHFGQSPKPVLAVTRVRDILIYRDKVWVSSLNEGVVELLTNKTNFTYLESNIIEMPQVVEYDSERLLINSTRASLLRLYNTTTESEEALPFTMPKRLAEQYKTLALDSNGRVYIVCQDSKKRASILLVNGDKTTMIESSKLETLRKKQTANTAPLAAIFDSDDNLWIAYQNDIYRVIFNKKREVTAVEPISDNPTIQSLGEFSRTRALYLDEVQMALWIGTNRSGLLRIDLDGASSKRMSEIKIESYKHNKDDATSLSSNFVSSILRTSAGTLFVGTEQGGLCQVIEREQQRLQFKVYSERDGLSNNVVKSLQEDHRGNLWVATNIGLNFFNTKKENFTIYRSDKSLPFESFWYSSLTLSSGHLLFTGTTQLLSFNPELFYARGSISKINFDELKIFNNEIIPNEAYDGRVILNHRLHSGDRIELDWTQNVFSIGIDLIRDQYSLSNSLQYRLLPTGDNWITLADNQNNISFSAVTPGRYTLEVRTLDSQSEVGDISSLKIVVTPPIWKSTHAYILYGLVLLLIIGVIIYTLLSFQSLSHHLHIQIIEKSTNEDKLRYFSNITHELKTPLSLILAPVALLADRFKLDDDVTQKLGIIRRQSKKLLDLVELTHGVEANDLKTLKPQRSLFSFNEMVRDLTADFIFISQYDNKRFEVQGCAEEVAVEADRAMVEKVINNLLSNALKHTATGNSITLSYCVDSTKSSILLKVTDSGYGIGAEDIPHIFERFYQARRSGSHNIGGTGIGLTFSKMLVELHNGTIEVESELNVGSTFSVQLPIVVDKSIPKNVVYNNSLSSDIISDYDNSIFIESEFSQSTIFIVEDNQELRALLCEVIGRYFNVKSFANGMEMIECLDTQWPDLIVSDVMMPEMDGYEVCRRVKSDIKTSHIPVVLLTACSTVDDKIRGLQLGADDYIPKPFYPRHLITRVEMLLHNRRQLRERFQIGIPLVYGKENNTSAKDNEFMSRLYDIFNKNLSNEEIDLDWVARELGQNRTMFFKKVKVITNTSPYELLKEFRLKRAAEMLQSSKYNVSDVCMLTGFKGRSHFSRVFKERYGLSPSKYAASVAADS